MSEAGALSLESIPILGRVFVDKNNAPSGTQSTIKAAAIFMIEAENHGLAIFSPDATDSIPASSSSSPITSISAARRSSFSFKAAPGTSSCFTSATRCASPTTSMVSSISS